jgi:predicted secreted Zn-dependent protease
MHRPPTSLKQPIPGADDGSQHRRSQYLAKRHKIGCVPPLRSAGVALVGLFAFLIAACGGDNEPTPPTATGPSGTVALTTPAAVDGSNVELATTLATTYYLVSGTTTEEIFASIEENGPADNVGQQGSGLTSVDWEYKWTGDVGPSGACSIRNLTITADITVELPQHSDEASLSEAIRSNFQTYAAGVAEHEQRHVDIYLEGAEDIKAAMEAISSEVNCDLLEARIDRIWNDEQTRINGLQETFHNEENARLAASRGPLEQQIDVNRDRLEDLQDEISVIDLDIGRLKSEIAVFDNEVASIDAQIKQINDQFPDDLPPTIRDRLAQLIEQSNDLIFTYNQKVEEHNAAITARNALSDQYDNLLFETNQLVDQYNWTR